MMPECYPQVLFVPKLNSHRATDYISVLKCYYPEDIALFKRKFIAAEQAATKETAIEDEDICQRMHDGRQVPFTQGMDEFGPYQHPIETGMKHFHFWLRTQPEPHPESRPTS